MKVKKALRIVFIGCVKEGKECLQELVSLGCNIVAIFTFTDAMAAKTSGAVSFQDISKKYNIPLYKVKSTNTPESVNLIKQLKPDVIFVIGWTRLVSNEILRIPQYGCFGMHASLLPKYRGRAPVNWALINNEPETGNSLFLLDEGVDTGKVFSQKKFPITISDTCETLYSKVAQAGKEMIGELLSKLGRKELQPITQNAYEATVMPKRTPEDGLIDWNKSALEIFNWVRALTHPYPGAFTFFQSKKLFIWEARIAHYPAVELNGGQWEKTEAGTVVSIFDGIAVSTGRNELLTLHRLSYEDEDEGLWQSLLSSNKLQVGDIFGLENKKI